MYGFWGVGQLEVRFGRMSPKRDDDNEQGKIGLLSQWTMEGGDEQLWKSSKYIGRVEGGKVAEGVS